MFAHYLRTFGPALALAGWSVAWRYTALTRTDYANGWDTYFYLLQLKSWLTTGRMHSPEYALLYPLLRSCYALTGDYILAAKCCAAALTGWLTYLIARMESRATDWPGLATAWVVFSPHLTWFAAQYPKNLLGFGCFACCVAYLASGEKLTARRGLTIGGLLVLNYFGHRLTFVVSVLTVVFWLFFTVHKTTWRAFFFKKTVLAAAVAVATAAVGWLGWHEWERAGQLFNRVQFGPWAFVADFGGWPPDRMSVWWLAEVGIATGLWVILAARAVLQQYRSPAAHRALVVSGLLLLIPWSEWSLTSLAYRLFLTFVLLAPLLLATRLRSVWWPERLMAGLLLIASAWSWQAYQPARHDPDYAVFDRITRRTTDFWATDPGASGVELVIAPNALAEYFTFTTGIDAMPWLPEYAISPERLWRIAGNIRFEELRYFAGPDGAVRRLPGGYCLLREDRWQAALQQARAEQDDDFTARATVWPNPSRIRPAFLLKKKR